nr:hypothetical protein CPGR_04134 [Mycolicibacter nonchromogenicus]
MCCIAPSNPSGKDSRVNMPPIGLLGAPISTKCRLAGSYPPGPAASRLLISCVEMVALCE